MMRLADDERVKAESFRFEIDRSRYLAGRGILRSLLACYVDVEPESLRFSYGPFGKPFLAGGSLAFPMHFNVAHAGGRAVFAFSRDQEIGIDLEYAQPDFDFERVANASFPPAELAELHSYAAAQRLPEFFRIWTRLEAFAKASGRGLSLLENGATGLSSWNIAHFYPEPGYVAAIATKCSALKLKHYKYHIRESPFHFHPVC
jgi:4'-phosphopantetheinyl transferase